MSKMTILVPEINFLNFPLYFFLSFLFQVKTFRIYSFLLPLKGRIEFLDLSDFFDWEEDSIVRAEAVKIWKDILAKFPIAKWQVRVRGRSLNLSLKVKQDFQREIVNLLFMKKVSNSSHNEDKIYIVNSLKFNFLARIDKSNNLFYYPTIKVLSSINVFSDLINFMLITLYRSTKLICQYVYGFIFNKKIEANIKYFYDGISPRELSTKKDRITFSWIIDGKFVHKKEILFLLPKADFQMKTCSEGTIEDKGLLLANQFDMVRFSSYKILFSCLSEILRILVKNMFLLRFRLEHLIKLNYIIHIFKWLPVTESLKPKIYISSGSKLSLEEPVIIYFNAIGIKTIMWTYSVNSYISLRDSINYKLWHMPFCNIASDTFVVWSQHYKEFVEEHPQESVKVKVIGPIMSGDEDVLNKEVLCKKMNLPYVSKTKYIALFDMPMGEREFSRKHKGVAKRYVEFHSDDYNYAFIRDIYTLLSDFEDITLLYKPKRSLRSVKFSYSDRLKKLFKDMEKNSRVIFLDYNINPWTPIALADMCISMPFGSPTVAALHYGKAAIFYDPLDIVHYHRYGQLEALIAHNFNQLKKFSERLLFNPTSFEEMYREIDISDFVGNEPGTNSSIKFREYLRNI